MKIKEVELKSGMDRGTIYYYEKEGLFNPSRTENGYRQYKEKDLIILKRIKLLRSLHISIEDIEALITERADLHETLLKQINHLEQEDVNISYAKEICKTIHKEEVSFVNLDPEKYTNQINIMAQEKGSSYFKIQEELPQVFDPIRRFFARFIDIIFYTLIWNFILSSFKVNILSRTLVETMVDGVAIVLMMLFLEPIFIRTIKTTLGKAIFGMTIEDSEGGRLTLEQSYNRTWGVLSKGLALEFR